MLRRFVAGLILALFTLAAQPSAAGVFALAKGRQSAWPTLAPGASFTGTPCSGYGGTCINSDNPIFVCSGYGGGCEDGSHNPTTRAGAQPAIHWLQPSELPLVSDRTICVDADAKGGIAYVKFYGEGGTAQVFSGGTVWDTDANGNPRTRGWGHAYCVTLDAAAWKAKTTTGSGKLYAEAVANDATMAHRIIGGACNYVDGSARTYDTCANAGNYPMVIYPRTAANDGSYTVCASGCDATTIKGALDIACTATKKSPLITINQTGFYELENKTECATASEAFPVLTTAAGVTATMGRAAAYSGSATNAGNAWNWNLGYDKMELRGRGIQIDRKNFGAIVASKPIWLNGIRFYNSRMARDDPYWNGDTAPDFSIPGSGYWDDVLLQYVNAALSSQRYVINTAARGLAGHIFYQSNYVAGTYVLDYSNQFFRGYNTVLKVAYDGRGGAGTMSCTGVRGVAGSCVLKVAGVQEGSAIAQGYYATDTNPTVTDLAVAINAHGLGWSATTLNNLGAWAAASLSAGTVTPGAGSPTVGAFSNVTVSSGGTNFRAGFDVHAEWSFMGTGNYADGSRVPRQNVIFRNNVARDFEVGPIFNIACTLCYDVIIKDNAWLPSRAGMTGSGGPSGEQVDNAIAGTTFGGWTEWHWVFNHNIFGGGCTRLEDTDVQDLTYNQNENNICVSLFRSGSSGDDFAHDAPWNGTFYQALSGGGDAGVNGGSNNTKYATNPATTEASVVNFLALFRDGLGGDYRPASGGTMQSNTKTSKERLDQRGCPFSPTDTGGPWASVCGTPTRYPF